MRYSDCHSSVLMYGVQKMHSNQTKDISDPKDTPPTKKGWWARFLERLARANSESPAAGCRY